MGVFKELIDPKILRILELLIGNKTKHFHLQKISKDAKVALASTFRIVHELVSLGIIEQITIGKMKIYKIAGNKKTLELEQVLRGKK